LWSGQVLGVFKHCKDKGRSASRLRPHVERGHGLDSLPYANPIPTKSDERLES